MTKSLVCRARDFQNDGIWHHDCGQDFKEVDKTFAEWGTMTDTLSSMWLEGSDGTRLKSEADARAWLNGEPVDPNERAEVRAAIERIKAEDNRNAGGAAFSPLKAVAWIKAVPMKGRPTDTQAAKNAFYKLQKALNKERKEALIYWGKVQECLKELGCAYEGKATKRAAFNKFCEFMEEGK